MYKLELIWHLVEILFMDSSPGGLVMPHLLNWVSLHFPACEERARSVAKFWHLCAFLCITSCFSPGLFCHRAVRAQSSMVTIGRRSPSLFSRVVLTRPEICCDSTQSSRRTRSPPSTSCCARCHCAVQLPRLPSLSSVGAPGRLR